MRPPKSKKKHSKPKIAPASNDEVADMDTGRAKVSPSIWRPGQDPIEEGEKLDYDPTAYDCLHALSLEYPCLSFDLIKDDLGGPRSAFPHSLQFVAATQSDNPRNNFVAFAKVSGLRQAGHGKKDAKEGSDSDTDMSDSDDEEYTPPVLAVHMLCLTRGGNRVRAMPQKQGIVAVWEDSGTLKIFDGSSHLDKLAKETGKAIRERIQRPQALHAYQHRDEGFALAWSSIAAGRLATGDNKAGFYVWEPSGDHTSWSVKQYKGGHTGSVEDIQWSPTEENVIASCSSDKTIRIWDTRAAKNMLTVAAHDTDVNVLSWNADTSFMLASGGDEGALKVWDLRSFPQASPVAHFTHHKAPVTSVEWSPQESSMLTTTDAEGQLCVWDLALERDPEEEMNLGEASNAETPEDLPPQLLFVHGGQNDLKEDDGRDGFRFHGADFAYRVLKDESAVGSHQKPPQAVCLSPLSPAGPLAPTNTGNDYEHSS